MREVINKFLSTFCTLCRDDESLSDIELMMDNHDVILFEEKFYYLPQNNMFFTSDDILLQEMLICTFLYEGHNV